MALKAKSNDIDESSNDEDSKMKSYITRQIKKFMKNANRKGFDKDRKQSSSFQFKSQDKGKKDARDGGQYTIPSRPKRQARLGGFVESPSLPSKASETSEDDDDSDNDDDDEDGDASSSGTDEMST
ncbi:uncharacterized protein LOC126728527 [Quercus robur]|uniref:uncharacterized protein LOC126728527 n=1 Tax=Quercus robur TaxID=38942 RepID=UPI0021630FB0|nr:uncharacterized protein LOC126728527 [Quercus robur]